LIAVGGLVVVSPYLGFLTGIPCTKDVKQAVSECGCCPSASYEGALQVPAKRGRIRIGSTAGRRAPGTFEERED